MRRRILRIWLSWQVPGSKAPAPSDAWIGKMVSTHGKPCSCSLNCANRRRWDGPTLAERIAAEAVDEDL
jgi:hypothetical protein